jgi:hypothetical protein
MKPAIAEIGISSTYSRSLTSNAARWWTARVKLLQLAVDHLTEHVAAANIDCDWNELRIAYEK